MATRLTTVEVRKRLQQFVKAFKDASSERSEASIFWTRFYECFGIRPEDVTIYEKKVRKLTGTTGYIDSFIPGLLIVEHKSRGEDLTSAYEQATDYYLGLSEEERPRYIIVSDFETLRLSDLKERVERTTAVKDLTKRVAWFRFLLGDEPVEVVEETPVNRNAAYTVSKLHEGLLRIKFVGRDLEVFLTRLLFCMFADDSGIFGDNGRFHRYISSSRKDGADLGMKIAQVFDVLNIPEDKRQLTLDDDLKLFPYINGDLFSDRSGIPQFDSELRGLLLESSALDWSFISPAIFGAMFQGVLEAHTPEQARKQTRRELGAHYTSERNIMRVITPLFLDDLRNEFKQAKRRKASLKKFYEKLSTLTFFDPACGCGNFLVIAYRELRQLEFEVIAELTDFMKAGGLLDVSHLCKVNVGQFYGIEIDDAAAHIARVALWITDHQMNEVAARYFGTTRATVPLETAPHIHRGNALEIDWKDVLPSATCSYIFGNPPFIGKKFQTREQKADMKRVLGHVKGYGVLDYVSAWYVKASEYINGSDIRCAFVSTNSICQGEQAPLFWSEMARSNNKVHFAHREFKWSNEGKANAAVHCVIVGFGKAEPKEQKLYVYETVTAEPEVVTASNINPYLVDAPTVLLSNRKKHIGAAPPISYGSFALDDGNFTLSRDEYEELVDSNPDAEGLVRPFLGGHELLHGIERYALWLKGVSPAVIRALPEVMKRVSNVQKWRSASDRPTTKALASTPTIFAEDRQPSTAYIAMPTLSSELREYIPCAVLSPDIIASNQLYVIADSSIGTFAILQSALHNAWIRTVCGRLERRIRYSAGIVYNNFPWPKISDSQSKRLVTAGQRILDARKKYKDATLAELYDPLVMPVELKVAHDKNNKVVDELYGVKGIRDDSRRAAVLFKQYNQAIGSLI